MQASLSYTGVAEASHWFHVLVEATDCHVTLPSGPSVAGFVVWRKVRASDANRAGQQAMLRVAREWAALGLSGAPRLAVAAVAPLGRLTAWVVRDSAPQWLPA